MEKPHTDRDTLIVTNSRHDYINVTYDKNELTVDSLKRSTHCPESSVISVLHSLLSTRKKKIMISFAEPHNISDINDVLTDSAFYVKNASVNAKMLRLSLYTKLEEHKSDLPLYDSLLQLSIKISRHLREVHFTNSKKQDDIRRQPLMGTKSGSIVTGSLGAFPEFILPTFPCIKAIQGYCSPCFFSKVDMSEGNNDEVFHSFEIQTKYIIDNFDNHVIKCQLREDVETKKLWDVTLCFASNGSLFSDCETTRLGRYNAFKMLNDEIDQRNLSSLVYVETCVDDYLKLLQSDELNDLLHFFKRLNVVFLCGFESVQEFTRNVLYAKRLSLPEFKKVVDENKRLGLQTGAFLYSGYYAMTQNEIILDMLKSLCYLSELDVLPVIMIPKLHELTLPDLLYRYGKYELIDPFTVLKIAKIVAWITLITPIPLKKDRWMMSDLIDDIPVASTTVFNNPRKIVCENCALLIRETLQLVRSNMDYSLLDEAEEKVHSCPQGCFERYIQAMNIDDEYEGEKPLFLRTQEHLKFAEKKMNQYEQFILLARKLRKVETDDFDYVRKELLCFGINVSEDTLISLHMVNRSFGVAKYVHVAQVRLPDESYVNAPVLEEYCRLSIYTLEIENMSDCTVWLCRKGVRLFKIHISPLPKWMGATLSDGIRASNILNVHGHNILALVRHNPCHYKTSGNGCLFCSSDEYSTECLSETASHKQIAEAIQLALEENSTYSLALSGGSLAKPDRGAIYFSEIAKEVLRLSPNIGISVEIAPPESNEYIDMLVDAGVKTIIMNFEVFDDTKREKFCPGKFEISKTRYLEALKYAVQKLGIGRVSSVLIADLEKIESTIEGAKQLVEIGVIPTIIPFRPYDNSKMSEWPISNPENLVIIENAIKTYVKEKGLSYKRPYGCLSCNACIGTVLCLPYDVHEYEQRE
jgi:uncharacterized Fe-S cluster-containing MiaB family protein